MFSMGKPVSNLGAPRAICVIFFKLLCKLLDDILDASVHEHSCAFCSCRAKAQRLCGLSPTCTYLVCLTQTLKIISKPCLFCRNQILCFASYQRTGAEERCKSMVRWSLKNPGVTTVLLCYMNAGGCVEVT
jgi:hypothetical protein